MARAAVALLLLPLAFLALPRWVLGGLLGPLLRRLLFGRAPTLAKAPERVRVVPPVTAEAATQTTDGDLSFSELQLRHDEELQQNRDWAEREVTGLATVRPMTCPPRCRRACTHTARNGQPRPADH